MTRLFRSYLGVACWVVLLAVSVQSFGITRHGPVSGATFVSSGTVLPWVRLGDGRAVTIRLNQQSESAERFRSFRERGELIGLSIEAGDFDEDGVPDLVCGYSGQGKGFLTLQRGNARVFRSGRLSEEAGSNPGRGLEGPFLSEADVFELDVEADFLAAGDFNADGWLDLAVGARESTEVLYLAGLGNGSFQAVQRINLPGQLTAWKAADVNRPDGLTDLVLGVELDGGTSLLVFEGPNGALQQEPEQIELPSGPVVDIALADLDGNFGVDLVAALENELVIVDGRDRQLTLPEHLRKTASPRLTVYPCQDRITALAAGGFLGDREPGLAVLLESGQLQLISFRDGTVSMEASRPAGIHQDDPGLRLQRGSAPAVRLTKVKSSTRRQDDLALAGPAVHDLRILLTEDHELAFNSSIVATQRTSTWPQMAFQTFETPRSILPLRLNGDGFDDLVVLTDQGARILPSEAAVTLRVNEDSGGLDYQCTQPPTAEWRCTIRGALAYVSSHPGDGPFEINIEVSEITLEAIGEGSQGTKYIPPLTVGGPTTINGNGVVIKGVDGYNWGSASVGEKDAAFYLYRYGAKDASNSTIRDVTLDAGGSFYGICVDEVSNVTIENCRFGDQGAVPGAISLLDAAGATIQGNEFHKLSRVGVEIRGTSGGINVLDNYFGADKSGAVPPGSRARLDIGSPAVSCTIQGNRFAGIADTAIKLGRISNTATGGAHLIQGNTIGLNLLNSQKVPNEIGIRCAWHTHCTIGGTSPDLINFIGGNSGAGVRLETLSDGARLIGNFIGTSANGSDLGNGEDGIVASGKDLEIGGEGSAGNDIAFNGVSRETAKGVYVSGSNAAAVRILGNSIHSNHGLGIGFSSGPDPTPNDEGDGDGGPNNLQNYPVLAMVPNGTDIDLTLDSTPNTTFTIQVFANDVCDPSGYGEGQTLIDSFQLQTVGDGSALAFLQGVPEGKFITATATDASGNTSEFSACASKPEKKPFVVNSVGDDPDQNADSGNFDGVCSTGKKADGAGGACNPQVEGDCECTLRAAIQEANATPATDQIHFAIPGTEEAGIAPQTSLPPITAPAEIDGTTQPGYKGLPLIELAGNGQENGLLLAGGNSLVRGLVVSGFDTGIRVDSSNNIIRGNFIGASHDGSADARGSGPDSFASAANGIGIKIRSGSNNLIGGIRPAATVCEDPCNVVSSNSGDGIAITEGNQVVGNFIGLDRMGDLRFGNQNGITIIAAEEDSPTVIGGAGQGAGNVISANKEHGIQAYALLGKVVVEGNLIGTDPSGLKDRGNAGAGVSYHGFEASTEFWIGGVEAGRGNRIAFNKVGVETTEPVFLLSNEIFSNGLTIDFSEFNVPVGIQLAALGTTFRIPPQDPQISAVWGASTLSEFPVGVPVVVQLFRSGSQSPCEAAELLGTFTAQRGGNSEKTAIARRSVAEGVSVAETDYVTATATVPDVALGTSRLAFCVPALKDSDGDGLSDLEEFADWNEDGSPDSEQPSVGSWQTLGKRWTAETSAGALEAALIPEAIESDNKMHANGLLDLILSGLDASPQQTLGAEVRMEGSAVTVTLTPDPDPALLPTYVNYGPTPDDPELHSYDFAYDGRTGAEFFFQDSLVSRIVLHFVDGERGDHDLQENGLIVTRGGVLSSATQILYPLQLSSPSLFTGVGTSNFSERSASLSLTLQDTGGSLVPGFSNPAFVTVDADQQNARLASEIFRFTPEVETEGWIRIVTDNPDLSGLLLIGGGQQLDGAIPFEWIHEELYFTRLIEGPTAFRGRRASTLLSLVHPGRVDTNQPATPEESRVRLDLLRQGQVIATAEHGLKPKTALQGRVQDLLGQEIAVDDATDVLRATVLEGPGLIGAELIRVEGDKTIVVINADLRDTAMELYSPQVADLPGALFTSIKLVNISSNTRQLVLDVIGDSGAPIATTLSLSLDPGEARVVDAGEFEYSGQTRVGSFRVETSFPGIIGDVIFGEPTAADWAAALPLESVLFREAVFSQVASIPGVIFTGMAFLNPGSSSASIQIDVYSADGELTGNTSLVLGPGERISRLLSELVPSADGQVTGSIRVTSTRRIMAQQLFGDFGGTYLSAVPPRVIE